MDYETQALDLGAAQRSQIAEAGLRAVNTARDIPPIEQATNRITNAVQGLHTLAEMMEGHADRLFGEHPRCGVSTDRATPVRSGLIGNLEDAIDRLFEAQARLSEACGRNNTLA